MIIISVIIIISYSITLFWFSKGFKKVKDFKPRNQLPKTSFSILIPFRNEAKRINPLLQSLLELNYSHDKFQVVFIDDESTDKGQDTILTALSDSTLNFKIIANQRNSGSPKKDAISVGIKNANYDWILTTDADCALPESWLAIYDLLISNEAPTMVMGPVYFGLGKTNEVLKDLIQTEACALQIAAIGSLGNQKPILANGANLGYKKDWFIENQGYKGNDHIASGDDVFLLQKAIETKAKLSYAKYDQAVVYTQLACTWREYFWQRIRWASKTSQVPNMLTKFLGTIMAITNLWWILLLIAFIVYGEVYSFWAVFSVIKMLVDYLFLRLGKRLFRPTCARLFLLSSLLYPFASTLVLLGTKLGGYNWKNRHFKK